MLKVTMHDAAGQGRLELEGRLTGGWVSAGEHYWHTAQASRPNRTLTVDLTSVTFIDQAGRYLLRWMPRNDVRLARSDLVLENILDHITAMIR